MKMNRITMISKRGAILGIAIITITIASIITSTMFLLAQVEYRTIRKETDYIKASSFADLGVKYALYLFDEGHDDFSGTLICNQGTSDEQLITLQMDDDADGDGEHEITSRVKVGISNCTIDARTDGANMLYYRETR